MIWSALDTSPPAARKLRLNDIIACSRKRWAKIIHDSGSAPNAEYVKLGNLPVDTHRGRIAIFIGKRRSSETIINGCRRKTSSHCFPCKFIHTMTFGTAYCWSTGAQTRLSKMGAGSASGGSVGSDQKHAADSFVLSRV